MATNSDDFVFDSDAFLNNLYPSVGVGNYINTDSFDDLFPDIPTAPSPVTAASQATTTPSGVGAASTSASSSSSSSLPHALPPGIPSTSAGVGVGRGRTTVTRRTVTPGKQPRSRPYTGKRLPTSDRGRRRMQRRRRTLLTRGDGGGDSGSSDDDDDDDDDDDGESDASSTTSSVNRGGRHRMSQEELRRQLELLSNDQIQTASGRSIAGITTTNTITTTYKDGGRPRVARHSSRVSH